jgi:hypothetical protein
MNSLLWNVITEEQTNSLYKADDSDEILSLLGEYFDVPFYTDSSPATYREDPTQALCDIMLDHYKYAFAFCKEQHFTKQQTSVFLAMAKKILEGDIYGPDPTMEKSFDEFTKMLTNHSVSRSPIREGIFTIAISQEVFQYFAENYYRHFRMYQYNFNTRNSTTLQQCLPCGINEIPMSAPLSRFTPLMYDKHEVEEMVKHIPKLPRSAIPTAPPPAPEPVVEEGIAEDDKKGKEGNTKGKKGDVAEVEETDETKEPLAPQLSPYELHEKMFERSSKVKPTIPTGPKPSFTGPNRGRGISTGSGANGNDANGAGADEISEGIAEARALEKEEEEQALMQKHGTVDIAEAIAKEQSERLASNPVTDGNLTYDALQAHDGQPEDRLPSRAASPATNVSATAPVEPDSEEDEDDGQFSDSPELARSRADMLGLAKPRTKDEMGLVGAVRWNWEWSCRKTSKWVGYPLSVSDEIERAYEIFMHEGQQLAQATLEIDRGNGRKKTINFHRMVMTSMPSGDKKAVERRVGGTGDIYNMTSKRATKLAARKTEMATRRAEMAAAGPENGHQIIQEAIEKSKETWQKLNRSYRRSESSSTSADAGAGDDGANAGARNTLVVGFIADQDKDSIEADGHHWDSYYSEAELSWTSDGSDGDTGAASHGGAGGVRTYSLGKLEEHKIVIEHAGDKDRGESGRGAEFSALEMWQGELVVFDDRTGGVFALSTDRLDGEETVWNVSKKMVAGKKGKEEKEGKEGNEEKEGKEESEPDCHLKMLRGDGSKEGKGLKCEWATVKDGKLYVGSTGKERTADDGSIMHMGEMWVKTVDADWNVEHFDWTDNYDALRKVAKCQWGDDPNKGAGYMIHESARWSDVHQRWFFFPRKLSRETYDQDNDEKKCCNLMVSCDAEFSAESVVVQPLLTFKELRGKQDR